MYREEHKDINAKNRQEKLCAALWKLCVALRYKRDWFVTEKRVKNVSYRTQRLMQRIVKNKSVQFCDINKIYCIKQY